ncbi:MBL fold metallo-hydrolase [Chloroflexota bacterium]
MASAGVEPNRIITIRPDIYQIYAMKPGSHVYLVKGSDKNMLIDTGVVTGFPVLEERLNDVGLAPQDIDLVVLTHEHMDHAGAAVFFSETALIAAHSSAANKIEMQDEFVTLQRFREWRAGELKVDLWLEERNYIDLGNYQFRVLHTPGHTSGCICLYEPFLKLLFSGDTVFSGGVLSEIGPSGNISDYVDSIQRLNALKIDEFYPGHGRISKVPAEDMQQAVKYALALFEDSKLLFRAIAHNKQQPAKG